MIKSKKQMFIVVGAFLLVLTLFTTTYAFFNYTRTGTTNTIRVGRISFNSSQSGNVNLTNAFPITSEEAETDTTNAKTVSITITGDTDYANGVEYVVTASDVNLSVNNKVLPIALEISVAGINNNTLGTEETGDYYTNRDNYSVSKYKIEYNGKLNEGSHILVGYIAPNTTSGTAEGINGVITIKAYIDKDKILISDTYPEEGTDSNNDGYIDGTPSSMGEGKVVFTTTEWNSIQSSEPPLSFKVKVEANEGIWVDRESSPESCFSVKKIKMYDLNTEMNQAELNDCIDYIDSLNISFIDNGTSEDFCLGTGKTYEGTFQNILDGGILDGHGNPFDLTYLESHNIISSYEGLGITHYDVSSCGTDVVFPNKMNYTPLLYNNDISDNNDIINACVSYLTDYYGDENGNSWVLEGESYHDYCAGTGTISGESFQDTIDNGYESSEFYDFFQSNNTIVLGTTVKYPVYVIYNRNGHIFGYNNPVITSLVFNKDLKIITNSSLRAEYDGVSNITVPASVRYIGMMALMDYPLNNVENFEINILGKPFIDSYSIAPAHTIRYGGTCQELYNNSTEKYNGIPTIIYGPYHHEYNVITIDTDTCPVYSSNDG